MTVLVAVSALAADQPARGQTGKASATKTASAQLPIAPDRPGRWREAIYNDDASNYRCLRGPASTPLCAIANRMSCETYWDADGKRDGLQLCRNAYVHSPAHVDWKHVKVWHDGLNYRIERVRVATPADIDAASRTRDWSALTPDTEPRVGDILVTVRRRTCPLGPPCPDPDHYDEITEHNPIMAKDRPDETRSTFCLRQEGTRWRLVWWPDERPDPVDKWWLRYDPVTTRP